MREGMIKKLKQKFSKKEVPKTPELEEAFDKLKVLK